MTPREHRDVIDFGLSLNNLSPADAWDRLLARLAALGFGRCLYGFIPDLAQLSPDEPVQDIMTFMSSHDDEFMEMNLRHRVHLHCASVAYVTRHLRPTLMAPIIAANTATEALPQDYRDWLAAYNARTHAHDGVLVPLRGPIFSAVGGASTLVDPALDATAASCHAARHLGLVGALITVFHQTLEYSGLLPRERRLTQREREILLWLAQGLGTKQIAAKTGTSVSTIEKQLARARWRLSAGNNTNLLLKAMAYRLI